MSHDVIVVNLHTLDCLINFCDAFAKLGEQLGQSGLRFVNESPKSFEFDVPIDYIVGELQLNYLIIIYLIAG